MNEEPIEVEIVSETIHEIKEQKKPKKTLDNHTRTIEFWGKIAFWSNRISTTCTGFSLLFAFVFSILSSQNDNPVLKGIMVGGWIAFAFFFLLSIVGFIAIKIMRRYQAKDPNYSHLND